MPRAATYRPAVRPPAPAGRCCSPPRLSAPTPTPSACTPSRTNGRTGLPDRIRLASGSDLRRPAGVPRRRGGSRRHPVANPVAATSHPVARRSRRRSVDPAAEPQIDRLLRRPPGSIRRPDGAAPVPGGWERLLVSPFQRGRSLAQRLPSDPLMPTALAGLDADGKVARWNRRGSGLGRPGVYSANAGDHTNGIAPKTPCPATAATPATRTRPSTSARRGSDRRPVFGVAISLRGMIPSPSRAGRAPPRCKARSSRGARRLL